MESQNAREQILNKIKQALRTPVPVPFPEAGALQQHQVFRAGQNEMAVTFAEQFTKLQGKFAYCANTADLQAQVKMLADQQQWKKIFCGEKDVADRLPFPVLHREIGTCDVSITTCEALIARTGTMVLSSATASGRTASVYAPIHICIAYMDQMYNDISDALLMLQKKYEVLPSMISFATGPSRTADIEKTLVVGVHGPKEVYCFLVEERP